MDGSDRIKMLFEFEDIKANLGLDVSDEARHARGGVLFDALLSSIVVTHHNFHQQEAL